VCENSSGEKSIEPWEDAREIPHEWRVVGRNRRLVEIRQLGISDGNSDFDSMES
jgi:hypothetical protein